MFSKGGGTRENVVAVADIESGSAGFALVKLNGNGPAEVLASERRALSLEERTPRAAVSGVLALLEEVAQKTVAAYAAAGHTDKVFDCLAVIHAPLSRFASARKASALTEETLITEEMIAGLAREVFSQISDLDKEEIFESGVLRVDLNGYPTSAPVGKSAHHIEIVALASACNKSMRTSIESTFSKLFPGARLVLRSGVRAASSVIGSVLGISEECLIVDMASDVTMFTRLDRDMSLEHGILAEGYGTVLKKIAGNGLPEDTLSVLRMIEREDGNSASYQSALAALAQFEPELLRACGETLGTLAARRRLPDDLVLFVHHDLAPWLSMFFSRIDFTQFTLTMRPFTVRVLETDALAQKVVMQTGKTDAGIAVAAALVNSEMHI